MYVGLNFVFICLLLPSTLADKDTNLCPFTKYERYFRFYYPVTGYIYCTTGCCGYLEDRRCCPATADSTGIYVGCASAAVVLVVTIVAITICCVAKYHRKQVVVGISPDITRHRVTHAGYIQRGLSFPRRTCDDMYTRRTYDGMQYCRPKHIDRPPPYELAVYTIPEEEPSASQTGEETPHTQRDEIQRSPIPETEEANLLRCSQLKPEESEQQSSTPQ